MSILRNLKIASLSLMVSVVSVPSNGSAADDQIATDSTTQRQRPEEAWYDVTEWFDGNDYEESDEAIGQWKDGRFQHAEADRKSSDAEVSEKDFYGDDYSRFDWFVDDDNDGIAESWFQFSDRDEDNLYETHSAYKADAEDSYYQDYEYSELSTNKSNQVAPSNVATTAKKGLAGKSELVSGKVVDRKFVKRLGFTTFLTQVERPDGDKIWIDLGPENVTRQLFEGDTLAANGPIVKQGDKTVQLATSLVIDGKTMKVFRSGYEYVGTVKSTKSTKVRGQERKLAKIETESGKMMTVDLGEPGNAKDVQEGDEISVTGVPVKVGDRVILVADTTTL